ncbi:Mycobacterium terramassiliense ORFan, partial [Mycobacterium terramassiliense]
VILDPLTLLLGLLSLLLSLFVLFLGLLHGLLQLLLRQLLLQLGLVVAVVGGESPDGAAGGSGHGHVGVRRAEERERRKGRGPGENQLEALPLPTRRADFPDCHALRFAPVTSCELRSRCRRNMRSPARGRPHAVVRPLSRYFEPTSS